jgi:hypothetical protein
MNTGDRNTKGRAILKGPKGGLYVIGPLGTKLRTFTKATAAAPPAPSVLNLAKAHMNTLKTAKNRKAYVRTRATNMNGPNWTELGRYRNTLNHRASAARAAKKAGGAPAPIAAPPRAANTVTHKGSTYTKTNAMTSAGVSVYKKGGVASWYKIGANGVPSRILLTNTVHRGNGVYMYMKNYTKISAPGGSAPAPTHTGTGTPLMSAALTTALRHVNKLKTAAGRTRYVASMRSKLSAANFAMFEKHAATLGVTTAPAAAPSTAGPRAISATPRITTAERNRRLAMIRARLNAMRAAKLAAMPKKRSNVHKRLKNVVARVRARLRPTNAPTSSSLTVPFCHSIASVPRKPCKMRNAVINVYKSPMIDDGTMVATRASDIDLDWFKRQDKYVKNLSDYDYWTAQAHTNRSHGWIGPFLYRGTIPSSFPGRSGGMHTHIAPLWPQVRKFILDGTFQRRSGSERWRDNWIEDFKTMTSEKSRYDLFCSNTNHLPSKVKLEALRLYRDDLKRIIAKAPKSRKKMVLYRGASFDIFRDTRGYWHTLNSFCSAAYELNHALGYEGGSMQRITVLPGTPVLLVAGMNQWSREGEYEIMVNMGTKYLIRGRGVKRVLWTGRRRTVRVTDVTITK